MTSSKTALDSIHKQISWPIQQLYSRAPASFLTFSSLLLSYFLTISIRDYKLWMGIGRGGFLPKTFLGWLIHSLLRPLALSGKQVKDPNWLPVGSKDDVNLLKDLKQRGGDRPSVFGLVPHRQIKDLMAKDDPMKEEIISYLREVASGNPQLKCSTSLLENDTSPALFKLPTTSSNGSLSTIYLSGTKGEFAHVHMHDGSLHLILSPTDCRKLLSSNWGELHPLAGIAYRSHWLGFLRFSPLKSLRDARFRERPSGGTKRKAAAIPPTYSIVYRPRNPQEMEILKKIINSSVAFALS